MTAILAPDSSSQPLLESIEEEEDSAPSQPASPWAFGGMARTAVAASRALRALGEDEDEAGRPLVDLFLAAIAGCLEAASVVAFGGKASSALLLSAGAVAEQLPAALEQRVATGCLNVRDALATIERVLPAAHRCAAAEAASVKPAAEPWQRTLALYDVALCSPLPGKETAAGSNEDASASAGPRAPQPSLAGPLGYKHQRPAHRLLLALVEAAADCIATGWTSQREATEALVLLREPAAAESPDGADPGPAAALQLALARAAALGLEDGEGADGRDAGARHSPSHHVNGKAGAPDLSDHVENGNGPTPAREDGLASLIVAGFVRAIINSEKRLVRGRGGCLGGVQYFGWFDADF